MDLHGLNLEDIFVHAILGRLSESETVIAIMEANNFPDYMIDTLISQFRQTTRDISYSKRDIVALNKIADKINSKIRERK